MADVLIFSRQPAWRAGVGLFLNQSHQFHLAGSISDLSHLNSGELEPDLVIVDFDRECQVQAVRDLCAKLPSSKVVVVASGITPEAAFQIREAGVAGILPASMECAEFLDALERILEGYVLFDGQLMGEVKNLKKIRLTPREGQLVSLLAQGYKNKEIATALDLTEGTVKVYLSKLYQKVGAKDRFELALFGIKNMSSERHVNAEHGAAPEIPPSPELKMCGALGSLAVGTTSAPSHYIPRTLIA